VITSRLHPWATWAVVSIGTTSLPAGCSAGAQFETRLAPDFTPAHHAVSVLGVYKDGQMSSEAWAAIATRLTPWLRATECPVGYSLAAAAYEGTLVAAIDDYTRANGPTDELLAQLAPAAKGDLVLTVTVAGRPPTPVKVSVVGDTGSGGGGMGGGGGAGGGGRNSPPPAPGHSGHAPQHVDTNVLDIVASLFSVSQHHSVAEIAMQYSGETVDDALTKFAQQLAATLPGATCLGWDWSAKVDPERIRQSAE
jgi:hypothetical protein